MAVVEAMQEKAASESKLLIVQQMVQADANLAGNFLKKKHRLKSADSKRDVII